MAVSIRKGSVLTLFLIITGTIIYVRNIRPILNYGNYSKFISPDCFFLHVGVKGSWPPHSKFIWSPEFFIHFLKECILICCISLVGFQSYYLAPCILLLLFSLLKLKPTDLKKHFDQDVLQISVELQLAITLIYYSYWKSKKMNQRGWFSSPFRFVIVSVDFSLGLLTHWTYLLLLYWLKITYIDFYFHLPNLHMCEINSHYFLYLIQI